MGEKLDHVATVEIKLLRFGGYGGVKIDDLLDHVQKALAAYEPEGYAPARFTKFEVSSIRMIDKP